MGMTSGCSSRVATRWFMSVGEKMDCKGVSVDEFAGFFDACNNERYQSSISTLDRMKMNHGVDRSDASSRARSRCFSSSMRRSFSFSFCFRFELLPLRSSAFSSAICEDNRISRVTLGMPFSGFGLRQIALRLVNSSPSGKPSGKIRTSWLPSSMTASHSVMPSSSYR